MRLPKRSSILPGVLLAVLAALAWHAGSGGGGPAPLRAQAKVFLTRDEALALARADGERYRRVPLAFDAARKREIEVAAKARIKPEVTECFQALRGGEVSGYVCIDNMVGKSRYVTYLIRIEHPAGAISIMEMMEHREAVGANIVAAPHFMRRFAGKTADDWMFVGIDFPLISGSTLTQRAVVDGSRKMLHIYDLYLRDLPAGG